MDNSYTISQLARAAEVPTTTVRYYERIGLVEPEARSQGNYRIYNAASLRKLKFIRAAQAIGFTLEDIRTLLETPGDRQPSCGEVQSLIEQRLADIDQRMRDLRHVRNVLRRALANCKQTEPSGCCYVLDSLPQP